MEYKVDKKNITLLVIASVIVLSVALFVIFFVGKKEKEESNVYAPNYSAQMYLSPREKDLEVNSETTLDVMVNTQNHQIAGVDLILSYDSNVVEITEIIDGTMFPIYLNQTIDKENSLVKINGLSQVDSPITENGTFCSIKFKPLKSGDPKFAIVYQSGATNESNISDAENAVDTLTAADSGHYTVN